MREGTQGNNVLSVGRTGLASFLLAFLRPSDAKGATLGTEDVSLELLSNTLRVSFDQIERIGMEKGWLGHAIKLHLPGSEKTISGLSQRSAKEFKEGLEAARTYWWKKNLGKFQEEIERIHIEVSGLKQPNRYARHSIVSGLSNAANQLLSNFPNTYPDQITSLEAVHHLNAIKEFARDSEGARSHANNVFVPRELKNSKKFFDTIESNPLTDDQRKAVVIDEDHNLVVAAAGSGKTSVIVAKAGWLTNRGFCDPSELLLLAYAKDAQVEMEERILRRLGEETGEELSVRTFHGLGLSIIGEATGKKPSLSVVAEDNKALLDLLRSFVTELIQDKKYSSLMVTWFQNHFAPYRSETEFKNQGEYWNYIRANEIRSLKGEKLKSFEECEIANFLYLNGVKYEYEKPYEHDTATSQKRQYQPDFFLPEYGIYIEHFALSKSGDTPPFIDREEYLRSRQWKLELHATHSTHLIETFSHEKASDVLTKNLSEKLNAAGVKMAPIPPEVVFVILEEQGRVDPFTRLIATFLQHFKGSQLTITDIENRAKTLSDGSRAAAFVKVFEPVFERYQKKLADRKQIDFHDMINQATALVEQGRYKSPYHYLLVDEFQDISPGRANLLNALLENPGDAQLFAVGDDWQAIYRFAGSDIAIMREFKERFGASARIDLGTTFRCSEPIAKAATTFVLENPAQLRKDVSATRKAKPPCISIGLPSPDGNDLLEEAFQSIDEDVSQSDEHASVLVLGRYRHSRPKDLSRLSKTYSSLDISYMTIHRSKGLEADYVIIVGLSSGKYGFPTEIADDPLLDIVLAQPEGHANAEERRLFYVALTRARKHAYLISDGGSSSPFVKELLSGKYQVSVFGRPPEEDVSCPTCKEGRLERRDGANGTFYGCSNWPYCNFTQSACPNCSQGLPIKKDGQVICRDCGQHVEGCPQCDGWLQKKDGKFGPFLGCSSWPSCNYTRKLSS